MKNLLLILIKNTTMKRLLLILLCLPIIGFGQQNKDCDSDPDYIMSAQEFLKKIEISPERYNRRSFEIAINYDNLRYAQGYIEGTLTEARMEFKYKHKGRVDFRFLPFTKADEDYVERLNNDRKKVGYKPAIIKIRGTFVIKGSELKRDNYKSAEYRLINSCLVIPNKRRNKRNSKEVDKDTKRRGVSKKIYGVINDPDGYTNVREDKSSKSDILFKVYKNKRFKIIDNNGSWWLIEYNGQQGYMYKDRVDVIK